MHGTQRFGGNGSGGQIRRALQADRERVQARPPGFGLPAILDAATCIARGYRRHQRRVQATGQQHAVRHVAHQLAFHCMLEGLAQFGQIGLATLHVGVVTPRLLVVAHQFTAGTVEIVARRELRDIGTGIDQRLHFRGHAQAPMGVVAPVQRHHTDRVARHQHASTVTVPQREGEDAVELFQPLRRRAALAVERVDHLAVRAGLEVVGGGQRCLQRLVVVDLAVHRQRQLAIGRQQRLRTTGRIDDGQPFMDQQRTFVEVHAAPVRATVALALRQFQRVAAQGGKIVTGLQAEDSEDRTHGGAPVGEFHGWEGVRPAIQARAGCARAQKNPHRLMRVFWCPGVCCCLSTQGAVPHRPRTIIRAQIIAVVVVDGGGQADRHGIDPTPVSSAAQQLRRQPRHQGTGCPALPGPGACQTLTRLRPCQRRPACSPGPRRSASTWPRQATGKRRSCRRYSSFRTRARLQSCGRCADRRSASTILTPAAVPPAAGTAPATLPDRPRARSRPPGGCWH